MASLLFLFPCGRCGKRASMLYWILNLWFLLQYQTSLCVFSAALRQTVTVGLSVVQPWFVSLGISLWVVLGSRDLIEHFPERFTDGSTYKMNLIIHSLLPQRTWGQKETFSPVWISATADLGMVELRNLGGCCAWPAVAKTPRHIQISKFNIKKDEERVALISLWKSVIKLLTQPLLPQHLEAVSSVFSGVLPTFSWSILSLSRLML